jgi:tripartite-type tricarboxylate transporter receptor subunit TctC
VRSEAYAHQLVRTEAASDSGSEKMVRDLVVAGVVAMVAISARGISGPSHPFDRSVRPGGANALIARLLADKLGKVLSRPFIVENRPGGGTLIGTAAVASSPADGYTLLLISPAHAINPHNRKTLPFNPLTDFTPIAQITRSAYVFS